MIKLSSIKKSKELPKLVSIVFDQGFMSLTTLLTSIVLARVYTKSNFADLVLLFTISLFILGFQSALISKPYAISLNDFENKSNYFNFNLKLKFYFTTLIIIFFPFLYFFTFDNRNLLEFSLFLFYIISYSSYFFVRETYLSERKTKENLKYGVACSVSIITALVLILVFKIQNINYFLIGASITYTSIVCLFVYKNYSKVSLSRKDLKLFWSKNWSVGKWLFGANLLFHMSSSMYPWLILYLTSNKENVAVFGVLMSIASLVNPLLTAFSSYLLPIFVKINHDIKLVVQNLKQWNLIFFLMAIGLVLVGLFGGQIIINLFFGDKYSNLGLIVVYPFIVQAINIAFQPFKVVLNALKRTDVHFWVLIPRSIISLTLGYFLITKYGISGVFYTMITEILFYQLSYFFIYKKIVSKKVLAHG